MRRKLFLPVFLVAVAALSVACSSASETIKPAVSWPTVNVEIFQRDEGRIGYTIHNRSDELIEIGPLTVVERESGTVVYQTSMQLSPGFVFSNSFPADPSKEHVATYQLHKGGETKVFTVEYRPAEEG